MIVLYKMIYSILTLLIAGCSVIPTKSEEFINNATSFDESVIQFGEDHNCDYESLIRDSFHSYRIHYLQNEIWFFDFIKIINTVGAGNFYLMEVFTVNYNTPNMVTCSVKYFSSFKKRVNRIKITDKPDETRNGLDKLIQTLKNCDNGG